MSPKSNREERRNVNYPDEELEEVEDITAWPAEWDLWVEGWTRVEIPGYVSLVNSELFSQLLLNIRFMFMLKYYQKL